MHRITGPLTSGKYIPHFIGSNHVATVKKDGTIVATEHTPTKHEEEEIAWYYENLGNDRYRISHETSGKCYTPGDHSHGAKIDQECDPNVWIIKELETKEEYIVSPEENPSLYAHAAKDGSGFYLSEDKTDANWVFYKHDN